jgi:hypothetical protein
MDMRARRQFRTRTLVLLGVVVIPQVFLLAGIMATVAQGESMTPTGMPSEEPSGLSDANIVWCGSHESRVTIAAGLLDLVTLNGDKSQVVVEGTPEAIDNWRTDHEADYQRACLAARAAAYPPTTPSSSTDAVVEGVLAALAGGGSGVFLTQWFHSREVRERRSRKRRSAADELSARTRTLESLAGQYVRTDIADRDGEQRARLNAEREDVIRRLNSLRRDHGDWFKNGKPLASALTKLEKDPIRLSEVSGPKSSDYLTTKGFLDELNALAVKVQDAEYGDVRAEADLQQPLV